MADRFEGDDRPAALSVSAVGAPLHMARLLLVDDEHGTRFRVAAEIKQAGGSVDFANSGERAVDSMDEAQDAQTPYDLVLIDLTELGPTGLDSARYLREAGYAGPIVAMSNRSPRRDGRRCIEAGCDELVRKSDTSKWLEVVAELVGREKARRFGLAQPHDVTSELSAYPDLCMMLHQFVSKLPDTIESVLAAQRQHDITALREQLDQLKRSATSHGYLSIRAAAVSVQQELENCHRPDTQDVEQAIEDLVALCRCATASPSEPPPPSGPILPPSG